MNAEEKLNSLIAEYRLLKTEEEKKGFDEKMRHTLSISLSNSPRLFW